MIMHVVLSKEQVGGPIDASLQRACKKRDIGYHHFVVEDTLVDDIRTYRFRKGDLLYRVSQSNLGEGLNDKSRAIESVAIANNEGILTSMYYPSFVYPRSVLGSLADQFASGIPVIPSAIMDVGWLNLSDEDLSARVQKLGGFPVVLKVLGFSRGQGVNLLHTLGDLKALMAKVLRPDAHVILRKYVADYRHFRLVVVDDEVVAANEYIKPENDFRTNFGTDIVTKSLDVSELSQEIIRASIAGVKLRASILGGVDILIDTKTEQPFLAEVNVPCYFPRAEQVTGIDIAGKIVDAMVRQSQKAISQAEDVQSQQ